MRDEHRPPAVDSKSLHCYRCDHVYVHIGTEPHRGECPNCGSRAVPPAGEIEVQPIVPLSHSKRTTASIKEYPVRGSDSTDRNFEYHTTVESREADSAVVSLRVVTVDGERPLETAAALRTELVPSETISAALADVLEVESVQLRTQ